MEIESKFKIKGNRINACLYEIDMTRSELCEITQIDPSAMAKIIKNKVPLISLGKAVCIAKALGYPVELVFIF
jgi:transcriptional regulator with XRE-family HTH domain